MQSLELQYHLQAMDVVFMASLVMILLLLQGKYMVYKSSMLSVSSNQEIFRYIVINYLVLIVHAMSLLLSFQLV